MALQHAAILGAGISGITTATVLQESGFSTTVYAPLRADRDTDRTDEARFASLFPAACILPHSVEGHDVLALFSQSQDVFDRLAQFPLSGIRWQDHYELEARKVVLPEYTRALRDCAPFSGTGAQLPFNTILGRELSGWVARVLFADMPVYLDYLFRRYLLSGGRIVTRNLFPDDLMSLKASFLVNCTGIWSRELFGDHLLHPVRGSLMFIRLAPTPPRREGFFSYNYKPPDEEYLYDVYFFPRHGRSGIREPGWLLGGTREVGSQNQNGEWTFPPSGVEAKYGIPRPIVDLNRRILKGLTGFDVLSSEKYCYSGFRPGRTGGIRLEVSGENGVPVVHNYGHGGAGVALSWGCALRVLQLVRGL